MAKKKTIKKLKSEYNLLLDKMDSLDDFIYYSDEFEKLSQTQRYLTTKQRDVMIEYAKFLSLRIENLEHETN